MSKPSPGKLARSPAGMALQAHHAELAGVQLRELFARLRDWRS